MKKLLLILFTLSCFFAEGQILQKDNTYGREMNRLAIDTLFGLPKDTFLVPASLQNIPFLANKAGSIYTWNISTLVWDLFSPGETTTASQGITKVGSDFRLGGEITSNRQIDWDFGTKKMMMNVTTGTGGDFYFEATDTVNNPDVSSDFNSGVLRSKKIYRFPAYSATTFRQGHRFITEYQIKDSAKINSFGGDFGMSVANDMQFARTSDYTGRSVFVIGNQTREDNVPIHLSNLDWAAQTSTAGTNYKYIKGYIVGSQSYLVTRANDTLENWIGFNNMGFFPGGHVKTTYDFMGGYMGSGSASIVANPWGVFIWNARSKNFFAGALGVGDSIIESSSLIDVSSTTKGVIWPRMTTTQKNAIASPATGLIVFDTDLNQYNFYNGSSWGALATGMTNPMTTTGDIIYSSDNSGTPARLAAGTASYILTSNGPGAAPSWQINAGGSGANTALSNLASVAINTSLLPGSNNSIGIGNTSLAYDNIYGYNHIFKGSTSGETILQATAVAGAGTLTLPTGTATLAQITNAQTFAGNQTFSGEIINSGGTQITGTFGGTPIGSGSIEMFYSGGAGTIQTYNRSGVAYTPLNVVGSTVTVKNETNTIGVFASTGLTLSRALATPITSTAADVTLSSLHYTMKVDASGAARTITLPAASGATGRIYVVKKTDATANTVTIDANAAETIDGATTKVISTQYAGFTIQSDGTNWMIIGAF